MTARPGSHQAGLGVMQSQIQERFCQFLPLSGCAPWTAGTGWAGLLGSDPHPAQHRPGSCLHALLTCRGDKPRDVCGSSLCRQGGMGPPLPAPPP